MPRVLILMKDLLHSARAKTRLRRRLFLKAAGLGLSAPLAYRLVQSATAAPSGAPQRFMLFYIPHGMPPEHFNPVRSTAQGTTVSTDFSLTDSGVSILAPLEQHRSLVNIYEGFKYPGASTHEGIVKFLSGLDVPNSDDTTSRTSIEHFIGNELGMGTLALGAVPHRPFGQDFDAKLMWDGQAVVPHINPLTAYDQTFGGLGSDTPTPEVGAGDDLHRKLLTLTESDISSLQAELSSLSSEQSKLQTHLEAVQAMKAQLGGGSGGGTTSCSSAPELPAVSALRAKAAGQGDDWFLLEENFPDILAAQLQLAGAAMACNIRPVTAIQPMYANCEIDFGFMGSNGPHHSGLSHTGPQISGDSTNMTVREPFANAQRWFIEQLVEHTVSQLMVDDPAAPGSTVLDNTIILIASEIGEGAWHISNTREILTGAPPGMLSYMPLITIGGAAGALKTGQVLNYYDAAMGEGAGDRPAADLFYTLAKAMGSTASGFGASTTLVEEALA